jgi:hypothetical protein
MRPNGAHERRNRVLSLRTAMAAGVCATAAFVYSQSHSSEHNGAHPDALPSVITKERKALLAKLPLVPDSELPQFIRQQKIHFKKDVRKLESLDGSSIGSGDTVKWIAKLSMGNNWEIKVTPLHKANRQRVDSDITTLTMATFNQLNQGDGNWVDNTQDRYNGLSHKQTWELAPRIEDNPNLGGPVVSFGHDSTMPYDDSIIRLSVISNWKDYEEEQMSSLDGPDKSRVELTDDSKMIAHADINLKLSWYAGNKKREGEVSRDDADAVVSERPLSPQQYKTAFDKAIYYRGYMQERKPVTIISKHGVDGGAFYDQYGDMITLPERYAFQQTTQDHESAHALFMEMKDQSTIKHQAAEFTKLADAIRAAWRAG